MAKRKMEEMENGMADQPKVSPEMENKMADQPKAQPFGEGVFDLISKIRSIPEDAKVKEVFLYELIRNATSAVTIVRFESLVDEKIHGAQPELFINLVPDLKNGSLTIMDSGIGMTEDELVRYLCKIPEHAREKYMQTVDATTDPDVDLSRFYSYDREFSLGFHSAYMIADKVEITTKTSGRDPYKWVWEGGDSFTISRDTTSGDTLGRGGTKITLFLNKHHLKYVEECVLTELVKKYIKCFTYPIYIVVDDVNTKKEIVDDAKEKRKKEQLPFETLKVKFEGLRKLFKKVLGSKVKEVVVSDSLSELANRLSRDMLTFEINPRSRIMEELRQKAEDEELRQKAEDKDTAHGKGREDEDKDKDKGTAHGEEMEEEEDDDEGKDTADGEEIEDVEDIEDLILQQFESCTYNIWLYDMMHGTSYLQNPALDEAMGRIDFLGPNID